MSGRWDTDANELIGSALFNFLGSIFFCCDAAIRLLHRDCVTVLKLRGWLGIINISLFPFRFPFVKLYQI